MEELIVSLVANAPSTAVLIYVLYMMNGWGKALLEDIHEIKGMIEQTRVESRLSEAAQAKPANPWRDKTR